MKRTGHTLVELVIVVLVLSILASVAVPRLQFGAVHRVTADAVARQLVTDLRRARSRAILNAGQNPRGVALVMSGSSPYAGYQIIDMRDAGVVDRHDIPAAVVCEGGRRFEFGPLGHLNDGSDNGLVVSAGARPVTITIVPATGMVKCLRSE